jgi:hypothetical protein
MAVIAIIEDQDELDKIIKWYSKQVSEAAGARAPPLYHQSLIHEKTILSHK